MTAPTREQVKSAEPTLPVYLTPSQVADLLQVSEKTVSRWSLQDASMPTLRIGRVVRFEREALMTWLRRRQPRRSAQAQRTAAAASHN